jgi:hypothetical protein
MDGKHQLCELCGQRLSRVKHKHKHGPGHACHPRCQSSKSVSDATSVSSAVVARSHKRSQLDPGKQTSLDVTPPPPPPPPPPSQLPFPPQTSPLLALDYWQQDEYQHFADGYVNEMQQMADFAAHSSVARTSAAPDSNTKPLVPRFKRSYETLKPTQRWERRQKARQALQQIGVPLQALQSQTITTAEELIHLPTSVREHIRSVPSLHIPCEQAMIKCKQQLATTHATETGTFAGGAFITDPVRFVSVLCAQSPFLAVGGDAGGGHTKLGITYSHQSIQHYAALLVYEGGDSWLELQDCRAEGLTPFTGDSAAFPHIWAVLQHLIDTRSAFLNGDWCFINAVLGLMSPSATHPCPICIISHKSFTKTARHRTPADKLSLDRTHSPLLNIPPERIVPTPLHLFLGISNRIILDAFSELLGKESVEAAMKTITTVHSAGCGGKSDLYDLNGPEITKWIKRECSATLLTTAVNVSASTKASHSVLSRWLQQLQHSLLHSNIWTPADIDAWRSVVSDIHQHWQAETSQAAFPKLHMLHHAVEFAERYRFLGRASEAQIESFHATFNALFHKQHRNQSGNTDERLRRSLADAALRAVQPLASS